MSWAQRGSFSNDYWLKLSGEDDKMPAKKPRLSKHHILKLDYCIIIIIIIVTIVILVSISIIIVIMTVIILLLLLLST